MVLFTPTTSAETIAANTASITTQQQILLLASYIPFFLVPLLITVDMAFRVLALVRVGEQALVAAKTR